QRLPPRRRQNLPDLLHRQPRRRGDGEHLELPRPHGARAPGGVGGLAGGLPADAAVRLVALARRIRRGGRAMTEHRVGTREEWLAARKELLAREKEHTR